MVKNILDLNSRVEGKEATSFSLLPEGVYVVSVESVDNWVARDFNDALINNRDEAGQIIKGENNVIEKVKASFTAYSANIKLKIIEGEHKGRYVFANLTTHPDVQFLLDQFSYAIGGSIVLSELQKTALNEIVKVNVGVKEYTKTYNDPNTAIEMTEVKSKNFVKGFYKTDIVKKEDDYTDV